MRIKIGLIDGPSARPDVRPLLTPILAEIEREIADDRATDPPAPDATHEEIAARLVDRLRARGLQATS